MSLRALPYSLSSRPWRRPTSTISSLPLASAGAISPLTWHVLPTRAMSRSANASWARSRTLHTLFSQPDATPSVPTGRQWTAFDPARLRSGARYCAPPHPIEPPPPLGSQPDTDTIRTSSSAATLTKLPLKAIPDRPPDRARWPIRLQDQRADPLGRRNTTRGLVFLSTPRHSPQNVCAPRIPSAPRLSPQPGSPLKPRSPGAPAMRPLSHLPPRVDSPHSAVLHSFVPSRLIQHFDPPAATHGRHLCP